MSSMQRIARLRRSSMANRAIQPGEQSFPPKEVIRGEFNPHMPDKATGQGCYLLFHCIFVLYGRSDHRLPVH